MIALFYLFTNIYKEICIIIYGKFINNRLQLFTERKSKGC